VQRERAKLNGQPNTAHPSQTNGGGDIPYAYGPGNPEVISTLFERCFERGFERGC